MEYHVLKCLFLSMTAAIVVFGSLLNTMEKKLPTFISQSYRFGKFSYQGKRSKIKTIEVPKRWFAHFYVFAAVYSTVCLFSAVYVYLLGGTPPDIFVKGLNTVATPKRSFTVSAIATLVAITLMTAQCLRRFYETQYISVFSDAKMNLSHYFVGFLHYFGAVTSILAEAPGFTSHKGISSLVLKLHLSELHLHHYAAILTFSWAFIHQYRSAKILAQLRKDDTGNIVRQNYMIPNGDLFHLVSSPHMLCEVLIYLSLMAILWGNSIFPFVSLWVVSNQIENALLTHWWYQEKFDDYPKNRRAIFPFIL